MADASPIEWTDATWNPLRGCERVSPGCVNCYAEVLAARFSLPGMWGDGLATWVTRPDGTREARWTRKVVPLENMLDLPLHWKRPRRVFVNSMSDLFHKDVPDAFIAKVFDTMYRAKQHTFQVLTKRPARLVEFISGKSGQGLANAWAFPNVWLGFSAENQETWDERWPIMSELAAHGFKVFASIEPLLSEIDLEEDLMCICGSCGGDAPLLWVIVGGESGHGARPTTIGHIRRVVQACQAMSVPVFVKQLGASPVNREGVPHPLKSKKGGNPAEWPEDLRVRQVPA